MACRIRRYCVVVLLTIPFCAVAEQGITDDFSRRAEAEFSVGHGTEAIRLWEQALAEYRNSENLDGQLAVLSRMGNTARLMNQMPDAVGYLAEALNIADRLKQNTKVEAILTDLADAASESKNYTHAIEANRRLLMKADATHDSGAGSIAAARLGQALIETGQFQQAVPAFQRAAELFGITGNKANQAAVFNYLGQAYRKLEQYLTASDAYRKASDLAHQSGLSSLEADATHGLGLSLYYLGDYNSSADILKKAIRIARLAGATDTEASALMSLGNVQYFREQTLEAVDSYERVLELAKSLGNQTLEGEALGNLGLVLSHLKQFDRAIEYFKQDIAIARKSGNRLVESQALGNLATLLIQQSRYEEAIPMLQRSLELTKALQYRRGESIALRNLGLALLKNGQAEAAEVTLRASISAQEALRSQTTKVDKFNISLFDTQRDSYRLLQMALIAQEKHEAALEASELGRARALADLMAENTLSTAPSIQSIRSIARDRWETLIEYSVLPEDNAIYIWLVQPDGSVWFRRAQFEMHGASVEDAIGQLVNDSRAALSIRTDSATGRARTEALDKVLSMLYRMLIGPIEDLLPNSVDAPIILIPQGPLFLLPFAALTDDRGRALIESHTLAEVPSIQTLTLLGKKPGSVADNAVVIGNPAMPAIRLNPTDKTLVTLSPLPAAETEAVKVAALLNTQPLTGQVASKVAFIAKAQNAGVIHLATHGILGDADGQGMLGALVLAASDNEDGVLTTPDIMKLKLKADLVVLSACNTGLGKVTGDGVIGLSRSFMAAGARSVIVSLWSVPDQPTAELMQYFYKHRAEGWPKAAALRQAMLDTRTQHPDPVSWAGFIIVGESE